MTVMARRPLVRWVVPGAVLAAVIGVGVAASTQAGASPSLPPRTASQLLVDVYTARLDGASGTVVERADLGLPALPAGLAGSGSGSADLNALITGAHTLRVWYSGPDKARVALLGATGESDVIRNGRDMWVWSSSGNTAQHTVLSAGKDKQPTIDPSQLPFTPQQAADKILSMLNPTTSVSLGPTTKVAGRGAYQLVVAPKDERSLVAKVTIAVDADKQVPTQVQVFAKGHAAPAFQIGFDQVNFSRPDASRFQFTPPAGTKVTEGDSDSPGKQGQLPGKQAQRPGKQVPAPAQPDGKAATPPQADGTQQVVIGTGWTSVLVARMPEADQPSTGSQTRQPNQAAPDVLGPFLGALPQVSGSWGSGRLLQSRLFSVLLTDDGRILVGAVSGDQLKAVAGDPAAALK